MRTGGWLESLLVGGEETEDAGEEGEAEHLDELDEETNRDMVG